MSDTSNGPSDSEERPQLALGIDTGSKDLMVKHVPTGEICVPEATGPDSRLRKSIGHLPFFTSVTLRRLSQEEVGGEPGEGDPGEGDPGEAAHYEVIAGERRVAHAKDSGIATIPAVILPESAESYAPLIGLAENIARDSNPLREATEIRRLRENGHSEEDLVEFGIPKQRQKKALRLALAPEEILSGVREGDISVGAARKVGNMEAAMQRRCADLYQETGRLRHKDIDRIRKEHKQAEAEGLSGELFGEAPGAEDLEAATGNEAAPGGEAFTGGSPPAGGDTATSAAQEPTGPERPERQMGGAGSPLGRVGLAVGQALEDGHTERAILRVVHDQIEKHR